MIVLDASIVVEFLLSRPIAEALRGELRGKRESFLVPHLFDVEVASALRKITAARRIDPHRSEELMRELADFPAERYGHAPLLARIWELRHNFTCYDAAYIALAEATNSVLYTTDEKLRYGHHARVRVLADQ